MSIEEEFAEYLKSKEGCYRLAKACIERYEQMEYLGGSVTFTDLDIQECDDIGGLLQKNISNPVRIKINDKMCIRDRLESDRYDTEYLYNCFYGRKAFRNCKDAFRKYKILKDYERYEQNEIALACIGSVSYTHLQKQHTKIDAII